MITWWFLAAAAGPEAFASADGFVRSWFGKLIFLGSIWAIWYHTLAGIRHLIWDAGYLLELEQAEQAGWLIIIGSVLLTLFTIVVL
jgi:succinate dehydrogenase / fumarate reductase cytochrome b subunit